MKSFGTAFNTAHIEEGSYIYGPGCRFVIWLQGCSLRCKGCWNVSMWDFEQRQLIEREILLQQILASGLDGVTILGGEPLQQPENLLWLMTQLNEHKVHCMLYTGYEPEEIRNNPQFQKIAELSDILIPGRYREEERDTFLKWRGSGNQKIICKKPEDADIAESNQVEVILEKDGSLCCLGYPDVDLIE